LKVLGAFDDRDTANAPSQALSVLVVLPIELVRGIGDVFLKALGALAVAQRDIWRAQNCARQIVAALRRPR